MPLTWNERKYKTIRRNAPSSYYVEEFAVWMTREGVDEVFVLFRSLLYDSVMSSWIRLTSLRSLRKKKIVK